MKPTPGASPGFFLTILLTMLMGLPKKPVNKFNFEKNKIIIQHQKNDDIRNFWPDIIMSK